MVDPILPEIGHRLGASAAQVELLFSTCLGVMAVLIAGTGVMALAAAALDRARAQDPASHAAPASRERTA
ncbi:UPF0716 family protein affecting phage T7 exclusion [Deinobacterium chartae]|uniref:UPF0716 family protein affecting phage T7 exclusion n=1 Tax=Deinobacterium chartae TaxID=521158 RepID=A0A841HZ78_9DEIO|nr:hypothetical protein [Deinobacterium chartae]MBB6097974.1 UPF0716 family protein affecting phage T7 exclusion [Deinobacterium chartae]